MAHLTISRWQDLTTIQEDGKFHRLIRYFLDFRYRAPLSIIVQIPPGKYAAFLHVKTTGSWRGSWGIAQFKTPSYEKIFIGWSTSVWAWAFYSHRVGVEIAPHGSYPENVSEISTQTTHLITSDPFETSIIGTAELKKHETFTARNLAFYKCLKKKNEYHFIE